LWRRVAAGEPPEPALLEKDRGVCASVGIALELNALKGAVTHLERTQASLTSSREETAQMIAERDASSATITEGLEELVAVVTGRRTGGVPKALAPLLSEASRAELDAALAEMESPDQ
jgi:hypothetical protein